MMPSEIKRKKSHFFLYSKGSSNITLVLLILITLLGGFEFLNPFRTGAVTTAGGTINYLVRWTGTGSADVFGQGTAKHLAKWVGNYSATCGNGIVETGEACDNGANNGSCPAACSTSCTVNSCGGTSYAITVGKTGSGSGTVTSSPSGINCGSTCSATYTSGTPVTLTASAASGSTFDHWSGSNCEGLTGTCTVTMNAAQSVSAQFSVPTAMQLRATLDGKNWTSPTKKIEAKGPILTDFFYLEDCDNPNSHLSFLIPTDRGAIPGKFTTTYCSGGPDNAVLTGISCGTPPFAGACADPQASMVFSDGATQRFNYDFRSIGNIVVNATLDGKPWKGPEFLTAKITDSPYGAIGCSDLDSGNLKNHLPVTFSNVYTGSYTFKYCSGGPPGATLTNITPQPTQTIGPGETKTFTFNFVTSKVNQPPVVDAGPDQTITLPTNQVNLHGTVTDDGLP